MQFHSKLLHLVLNVNKSVLLFFCSLSPITIDHFLWSYPIHSYMQHVANEHMVAQSAFSLALLGTMQCAASLKQIFPLMLEVLVLMIQGSCPSITSFIHKCEHCVSKQLSMLNCLPELTRGRFLKHSPHIISAISRYGSDSKA